MPDRQTDRWAIRDCEFKDTCATYNDPLIDAARKGSSGAGCQGQSDAYRSRHCRAFACKYLSILLADMVGAHGQPKG